MNATNETAIRLKILGNVPSQKNSKQIVVNRATGRPFITSSKLVKQWQTEALWQLKSAPTASQYPTGITMVFYYDNRRRHDLDNSASTVLDILVKAGVVEDDNVNYIDTVTLQYGGYDKQNPRVEIYIDG